jgi:23S rRNA U2552 (ribose-2'-O)-methylase RlmE/FtsJ
MGSVTTMKITDKKQLVKLVSFITMSDGSVHRNRNCGNCIFSFSQTEDHSDFVDYVRSILENITSTKTIKEQRVSPRKNIIKLYTPVHPFFNDIRDRIYVDQYKSVDQHALKLLDFEALAILYMSDGCLGVTERPDGKKSFTTTIAMCRLSYGDQLLLKKAIKEKLDIEFNVVKTGGKYYCLRLRSKDAEKFFEGIRPYVLPSFDYKMKFERLTPIL